LGLGAVAPDLTAVAAVVEAGARREKAVRDSVAFSIASNLFGAGWGLRAQPGVARASYGMYATALAAMSTTWLRLRGGERPWTSVARLVDPRPERWGRREVSDVLRAFKSTAGGLTSEDAERRHRLERPPARRNGLIGPILDQVRSPLTGILAAGAGLSLLLGATADVLMIAATICANTLVGAWQERQTGQAVAALQRIDSLRADDAFGGWVAMIARNQSIDYYRHTPKVTEINEGHLRQRPPSPEAFAVMDAIRSLPDRYRERLSLRLVEGLTGPEIAAQTGLTADAVRVNLHRGMKMLRDKLEGKAAHE